MFKHKGLGVAVLGACAVLATGCMVQDESAVRVLNARPLKPKLSSGACERQDVARVHGSLDISAARSYVTSFDLLSELRSGGGRNDVIISEVELSYTASPTPLAFETERQPLYFVIPPGADPSKTYLIVDLIGPKAGELLANSLSAGETLEVNVNMRFHGHLASGQAISTNAVDYPITVYSTGFAGCTAPLVRAYVGPCASASAQDGSTLCCAKADCS